MPSDAIARFYAQADLYVQTPDIDNMPSSILEALASGLPVVSTEAGGVPAILTDGRDGLAHAAGDHEAVADGLLRLLDAPAWATALAESGRANAERFTWSGIRERWLEVYRSVFHTASAAAAVPVR